MHPKQRILFVALGWATFCILAATVSADELRSLNHWFWTSLPGWMVIMGYGLVGMVTLPVLALGLVQSTWLCIYEPYYKWRYQDKSPGLKIQEDDWRLAGNPEFPTNKHESPNTSIAGDSNDAFRKKD